MDSVILVALFPVFALGLIALLERWYKGYPSLGAWWRAEIKARRKH